MAIITIDGALAGMQPLRPIAKVASATCVAGRPQSLYFLAGAPGAAAGLNAGLNGAVESQSSGLLAGFIPHTDPGAGNSYLARLSAAASQAGVLLLCDRLWDNTLTIASTSVQSITSPTWPARDNASSTNGDGVQLAIEIQALASSTAAALTAVTYTNSAGTGSKTGVFLDAPTAVAGSVGQFYRITMTAGDTGVRSVQSVQFTTAWTTGTIGLVAYRVLAALELVGAYIPNAIDALTRASPRLSNGVCPFLVFIPNAAAVVTLSGSYIETQG